MDWRSHWKDATAAIVGVVLLWIAFVNGDRVPLLGSFDLGIHELGHLITRPFGHVISFVMGSGLQVMVPFGLAAYFWFWRHDRIATGFLMVWGATSMQDASVYIADAPYQALPLIGGTHDWWYLLSHFGKLSWANEIARGVWLVGLGVGLVGIAFVTTPMARSIWEYLGDNAEPAVPVSGKIRQPRPPTG